MRLLPALKIDGEIIKGNPDDSHNTLGMSKGLGKPREESRGFVTPDGQFLNRKAAVMWLRKNDIKAFRKIPSSARYNGLHSEHLAKVYGVTQKPEAVAIRKQAMKEDPKPEPKKVNLKEKTVIVYDRGGLYLYCAEKLAESFGKVMYFMAEADAYPTSQKQSIGAGLKTVKRIHDFWEHIDEADMVAFFDCYDGQLQHWLKQKGYNVFGSRLGEKVEIDKTYFLELLEKLELPCPETYLAEGMGELVAYLEKNDDKTMFLKNLHRGDFESRKFVSMAQSRPFLDDLKKRLGSASDTVDVLVQHKIDSACEAGWDGYMLDGEYSTNGMCGYELKDVGYVGKVFDIKPEILAVVDEKFTPEFKKLGYAGNYSTEIRITEDGVPYYIDATCRIPSPPGELMCELYENWAEMVWDLAHDIMPVPKPKAKYGAEIVLTSGWYSDHELHVKFPKEIAQYVKLKNHTQRDNGELYCIPNGNGEFFGAVVAWGNTVEEATKKCLEYAEQIEADELNYDASLFDKVTESIKAGEQFGINFD